MTVKELRTLLSNVSDQNRRVVLIDLSDDTDSSNVELTEDHLSSIPVKKDVDDEKISEIILGICHSLEED